MTTILVVLAMFAGAFFVGHWRRERWLRRRQDLAAHLGLKFDRFFLGVDDRSGGSFDAPAVHGLSARQSALFRLLPMAHTCLVSGQVNGVDVAIGPAPHAPRKGIHTGVSARFRRPLDLGLRIATENVLGRIGRLAGAQDIRIGNDEFDRKLTIHSRREADARMLLGNGDLQHAILELFRDHAVAVVDDEGVHTHLAGFRSDPDEIRQVLDKVTRTALAIESVGTPRTGQTISSTPGV